MSNTLLPCPFCGGEEIGLFVRDGVMRYYWYECAKCYCGTGHEESEDEARAAWNRRAQPENEPLTLDELRQMDGEPVWVQELPPYTTAGYKVLAAPAVNEYGDICFDGGDCYAPYDYGKTWLAYRTKPERSEG